MPIPKTSCQSLLIALYLAVSAACVGCVLPHVFAATANGGLSNALPPGYGNDLQEPPFQFSPHPLPLLQPLDDTTTSLPPSPGLTMLFEYFNLSWPWVLGVAAGIGVLQALIGGIQVMLSGNDSGLQTAGKEKIMWATAGLLMVGLASLILETLNPLFYQ